MKNLKLSLKFPYEDIGIYFSLLEENVKVRIGCGHIIVYLNKFRTIANQIIWKIPRGILNLSDANLYIEISESGGLSNKYSYSHIVCLGNGNKLRPYHIPGFKRPNEIHANFAIRSKVCTVECFDHKYIKITEFTGNMLLDTRICYVSEVVLFEGLQNDLPKELEKFSQAIIHAVIKANCPDCRHSHYFCD
jgi:hypothetical protein